MLCTIERTRTEISRIVDEYLIVIDVFFFCISFSVVEFGIFEGMVRLCLCQCGTEGFFSVAYTVVYIE